MCIKFFFDVYKNFFGEIYKLRFKMAQTALYIPTQEHSLVKLVAV